MYETRQKIYTKTKAPTPLKESVMSLDDGRHFLKCPICKGRGCKECEYTGFITEDIDE
jgi:hypothetical protein